MLEIVRAIAASILICAAMARGQSLADLRVGQWVELKGARAADGVFDVSAVEVLPPGDKHVVLGAVTEVDAKEQRFHVLGLEVSLGDPVRWDDGLSLADLSVGQRVKVEGSYRGDGRFVAREIAAREAGRDRIVGRVDWIRPGKDGYEAEVIGFRARIAAAAKLENESPFAAIPLAAEIRFDVAQRTSEDEDYVPGSIRLAEGLTFGGLIETKYVSEDGYDLRESRDRDVQKTRITVRPQLLWTPSDRFSALAAPRFEWNYRDAENGADSWESDVRFKELWVWAKDLAGSGVDLQVGRQDFDDPREWIYKKDLDAARAVWRGFGLRVEASLSTYLGEVNDAIEDETENAILYVSNDDSKRHLAGWVVDRRAGGEFDSYPIHFGVRMLGEWLPATRSWFEASLVRGYENDTNLSGYGFDVGTTWNLFKPFYMSAGWAFGSGDDGGSSATDESFRQTGLERNNGKLGGVTSFRYYGEILDPELSNLSVLTLGVGTRITRDSSVDLVWHGFDQDTAAAFLRRSDLDAEPDGVHTHLGQEVDLILGLRDWNGSDFEFVTGWFDPGAAFSDQDDAWKVSFQWRFRF